MTKGLKRVATVAVQILILLAIIIGVAFYNDTDSLACRCRCDPYNTPPTATPARIGCGSLPTGARPL